MLFGRQGQICIRERTRCVSAYRDRDGSVAPGTGRMVLAFCPQLTLLASFANTVLVHGRCIGTRISYLDKVLTVVNIHNYGVLKSAALGIICPLPPKMLRSPPPTRFVFSLGILTSKLKTKDDSRLGVTLKV